MEKKKSNDEIDLVDIIIIISNHKFKIFLITLFSISIALGLNFTQDSKKFVVETELKPVNMFEENKYNNLNYLVNNKNSPYLSTQINKLYFFDLFIDKIKDLEFTSNLFDEFGLIEKKEYSNEIEYKNALKELASKIEIISPKENQKLSDLFKNSSNWIIKFNTDEKQKWLKILSILDKEINSQIRLFLLTSYENKMNLGKKLNYYEINQLLLKIENTKKDYDLEMQIFKLKSQFAIEDIETQISNALANYEKITKNKLAFLREQAAIARELGVAKNTIEIQTFNAQNNIITNMKTDSPFYLRGYEAIEKEIEIIETRIDTRLFTKGLLELEQKKILLQQDKTLQRAGKNRIYLDKINDLKNQMRTLQQDNNINIIETYLLKTPIFKPDEFTAAKILYQNTKFKKNDNNLVMVLLIAAIIGFIVGVFYFLIAHSLFVRKR